jgi:basic amino acid/polyamine antiporter, APA family
VNIMQLKRELNLFDVFCITAGSMVSSGLFVLPGIAYLKAGPAVAISYILGAMLAVPAMLSTAELITAMPKAGGIYYFVSRSMGYGVGAAAGFARWLSISLKSSFALIGIGAYVSIITDLSLTLAALFFCLLFIAVNILGIKLVGRIQIYSVGVLFAALLFFVVSGLPVVSLERFTPLIVDFRALFSTAGFVFVSFGGLLVVTGLAEEVKRPERVIPISMILSLVVVGFFYGAVVFITVGVLDSTVIERSITPVSDAALAFAGNLGVIILGAAAFFALITTANAGIASASRYPMAMSRDGLLPHYFQYIGSRFQTPYFSILITGGFMVLIILLLKLEILVEVASTLLMLTYILVNMAVIVLRKRKDQDYQPTFRSPFYPWMQLIGIGGLGLLIAEMGKTSLLVSLLFVAATLIWYQLYALPRLKQKCEDDETGNLE